jgi:hypothetical protein
MFSHGTFNILKKIQLMVFPDVSGNKRAPKKCHNHTLAYLSMSCSATFGGSGAPKFCVIHTEVTPEVLLKFKVLNKTKRLLKESDTHHG